MSNAVFNFARPENEPVHAYLPGSAERASLKAELKRQSEIVVKIPLVIGGREIYTEKTEKVTMPHDHHHVIAECSVAGPEELKMAVDAALAAKEEWEEMPWEHRASIFLKVADMISGPYRDYLNAATMLGQSKTVVQAEIDSACELIDFMRFGVYYANEVFKEQPASSATVWDRQVYRPLDGFICAITPFNFLSISGNLPVAPAMLGNVAVWKPSRTAVLSNYYFMRLLMEAGLPAGVINFVPCSGKDMSEYVVKHPKMAGFHFTGSTAVFREVWKTVGENISNYANYPRLVGETGGKDFIFAHPTAELEPLVAGLVRGAFEFQGQKCSACSRAYIPASLWPQVEKRMKEETAKLKMGDVQDFDTFLAAVIDEASFNNAKGFIDRAKASKDAEVIIGGKCDSSVGWFVEPTVILCRDPHYESMVTEIFAPVLSIYVYDDSKVDEALELCDTSSSYGLTGAIYARDRQAIVHMEKALKNASGNFYINDKPTGAVVGQQPFGGARASGTNDKAGSIFNIVRWTSIRTIKEALLPPTAISYPYMADKD